MSLDGLLKSEEVVIEGWNNGKPTTIYELTYEANAKIQASAISDDNMGPIIAVKYGLGLKQDIEEIAAKMPMRIVSAINAAVTKAFLEVEDLEKNSASTQSDASASH